MDNAFGGIGSLLTAGGSMILPILLASVWSVAMLIEGIWMMSRARNRLQVLPLVDLKGLNLGDLRGSDPVTALFRWKLEHPAASMADLRDACSQSFAQVERRFSWLNTIAAIAPLFGLLGTVFGMIKIFHIVSVTKPANPIAALSGGIAEALVATGGGLVVAVVAALGYHFMTNRIAAVEADAEAWLRQAPKRSEETRVAR